MMYEQDLKLRKFANAVARRLRMPKEVRARVMSDFESSISARLEAGEGAQDILDSLGSAKKAATELNEQMKEYTYTKSRWRFAFLGAAVVGGAYLLGQLVTMALVYALTGNEAASMGVIGGADGPTAIFVSTPVDGAAVELKLALAVLALAAGIFGFWKLSHMKRK